MTSEPRKYSLSKTQLAGEQSVICGFKLYGWFQRKSYHSARIDVNGEEARLGDDGRGEYGSRTSGPFWGEIRWLTGLLGRARRGRWPELVTRTGISVRRTQRAVECLPVAGKGSGAIFMPPSRRRPEFESREILGSPGEKSHLYKTKKPAFVDFHKFYKRKRT